ncbi:hypothetical protein SFRURICE_002407 [Spodoptera frugiperda]|nr:hypothetical protein SFRURICE_002407 [Spodoptera frugiperda]
MLHASRRRKLIIQFGYDSPKRPARKYVKGGSKPSGGDLMADLHAKLSMRRRGISGAERAGGSVLHTLASYIPEPDQSSPARSSSEDDWE